MNADLLEQALDLQRRGWSVMPVHGKRPVLARWKHLQQRAPSASQVQGWFGEASQKEATGIALILGAVSGGLVCRDFDDPGMYRVWSEAYPDLARSLPTVRTRSGFHVYCCAPGQRVRFVEQGELRGDGGYTLVPTSEHPAGGHYAYLNPFPLEGEVPWLSQPDFAALAARKAVIERVETTETAERAERIETAEEVDGAWLNNPSVLAAFEATVPRKTGVRHRSVFEFARHLRGIAGLSGHSAMDLRPLIQEWHRRARPHITTKPFEDTWLDFELGWPLVRLPAGDRDPIVLVLERADANLIPLGSPLIDNPVTLRLGRLCRELQRDARGLPFFLSCAKAAGLLGSHPMQIWRSLRALESAKLLVPTAKGRPVPNTPATRYRYIGVIG